MAPCSLIFGRFLAPPSHNLNSSHIGGKSRVGGFPSSPDPLLPRAGKGPIWGGFPVDTHTHTPPQASASGTSGGRMAGNGRESRCPRTQVGDGTGRGCGGSAGRGRRQNLGAGPGRPPPPAPPHPPCLRPENPPPLTNSWNSPTPPRGGNFWEGGCVAAADSACQTPRATGGDGVHVAGAARRGEDRERGGRGGGHLLGWAPC